MLGRIIFILTVLVVLIGEENKSVPDLHYSLRFFEMVYKLAFGYDKDFNVAIMGVKI